MPPSRLRQSKPILMRCFSLFLSILGIGLPSKKNKTRCKTAQPSRAKNEKTLRKKSTAPNRNAHAVAHAPDNTLSYLSYSRKWTSIHTSSGSFLILSKKRTPSRRIPTDSGFCAPDSELTAARPRPISTGLPFAYEYVIADIASAIKRTGQTFSKERELSSIFDTGESAEREIMSHIRGQMAHTPARPAIDYH